MVLDLCWTENFSALSCVCACMCVCAGARKDIGSITTLQDLILALAYPMIHWHWINRRKDKIGSLMHIGIFSTCMINIQEVLTKMCKHVTKYKMCTLFFRTSSTWKGGKKIKALLIPVI